MSVARKLAIILASYLTTACIGDHAQTLSPLNAAATTPSKFLFSVDVVLDDSAPPVLLGIRHGQTVAQSALEFCREQGFNAERQTTLMSQLIQILEDGIAEVVGPTVPLGDEMLSPSWAVQHTDPDDEGKVTNDVTLGDPVFTLGISVGGEDERTLSYYAGQDPANVAAAFCTENLVSSSPPEALERCFASLLAHITETLGAADSPSTHEPQVEQQTQQQQQQQPPEIHEELENSATSSVREPMMTVPLKINGLETVLQIFRESRAEELADELCRREEFHLEESSMDSCLSQIVEIVHRAAAHETLDSKKQVQRVEADPFTFKVPVTLAGLQLHAEFRTNETPRTSALRFCTPILPVIESTLGLELYEGDDEGQGGSQERGLMSEARESLKEACAVVVEDAINAVLLGLRESVIEAEMAQANRTDSSNDIDSRWSKGSGVAGESLAASQVVADTMM